MSIVELAELEQRPPPVAGSLMTELPNASPPSSRAVFPVAGIGCSAGGLAAAADLLRQLPTKAGLALVLLQHLDRTHSSELIGILGRVSPLSLHAIEDGLRPEANHVYVAPPNALVTLKGGLLRLQLPDRSRGEQRPIDDLFASLARDCARARSAWCSAAAAPMAAKA
jgi:two-component system CheB/CheR fusion protein